MPCDSLSLLVKAHLVGGRFDGHKVPVSIRLGSTDIEFAIDDLFYLYAIRGGVLMELVETVTADFVRVATRSFYASRPKPVGVE